MVRSRGPPLALLGATVAIVLSGLVLLGSRLLRLPVHQVFSDVRPGLAGGEAATGGPAAESSVGDVAAASPPTVVPAGASSPPTAGPSGEAATGGPAAESSVGDVAAASPPTVVPAGASSPPTAGPSARLEAAAGGDDPGTAGSGGGASASAATAGSGSGASPTAAPSAGDPGSGGGGSAAAKPWPAPADVLAWVARPAEGCLSCGKGAVVVGVADRNYAATLHAWLLALDEKVPGGIGSKGSGVAVSASEESLREWCASTRAPCWYEQQCEWLRLQLDAAGDLKRIAKSRGRIIAAQSCKVFALARVVKLGYTAMTMDLDVVAYRDPVAAAVGVVRRMEGSRQEGAFAYQCGERSAGDVRLAHTGYKVWPNSGLMLAAPAEPGASIAEALRDEAVWQGTTAANRSLREPWPARPRLPCREVTIINQIVGRTKGLHRHDLGWKPTDMRRLCRLLTSKENCSDKESHFVLTQVKKPRWNFRMRNKLRDLRIQYARRVARDAVAGNLTAEVIREHTAGLCRGNASVPYRLVPAWWCKTVDAALAMLGVPRTPSAADVAAWARGMCTDLAWGEQEVLREMITSSKPTAHTCLPEEEWAMVFRSECARERCREVPDICLRRCKNGDMRRPSERLVTLHLTGSAHIPRGAVRFRGGWERFEKAQELDLMPQPLCRREFRCPAEWWGHDASVGAGADPPPVCRNRTVA
eukprot:TRINITY_DN1959_c0_g1_i4.p1 TRINITY_DN1959_c0_g1~~TRINITY_DN1959_c0_g1_i4.p1  ORF type:complete len:717 (+),score=233.18 TRINITY_DN1959_c0_g1_i4:46-2151(+)